MKICFATRNLNKVNEIKAFLEQHFEILSLDDINCHEELPETTNTIEGNSQQKAKYIWDTYQIDCFADDSGLEVEALNGKPGVDSAFYSGTRDFDENMNVLLKNLEGKATRKAHFKTVITLVQKGKIKQFTGLIEGEILTEKRGENGFGYDPVFLPEGFEQTFAEMPFEEKNKISHRAKAVKQLTEYLT